MWKVFGAALLLLAALIPVVDGAISSGPMVIDSRDDWLRVGAVGNGTAEDPFRIEGLQFKLGESFVEPAISVRNVPDHAVFDRIIITTGRLGVVSQGSPNVTFENTTVRKTETAFEISNTTLRNVTITDNTVGVIGKDLRIEGAVFARNGRALEGSRIEVYRSTFDRNPSTIRAGPGSLLLNQSQVRGATVAVATEGAVRIQESFFDSNVVGFQYTGPTNQGSIRGSTFLNHSDAAVRIVKTGPGTWNFDASNNFWGRDLDGETAKPSPFGRGSPIDGPIAFDPVLEEPGMAIWAPGALFPANAGPSITVAGAVIEKLGVTDRLSVSLSVSDVDGIANVSFSAAGFTFDQWLGGEVTTSVQRSIDVPLGTNSTVFVFSASDMPGNVTVVSENVTYAPPPPPPSENETRPPPTPLEPQESPGLSGVLTGLAVATGAILTRKGSEGRGRLPGLRIDSKR